MRIAYCSKFILPSSVSAAGTDRTVDDVAQKWLAFVASEISTDYHRRKMLTSSYAGARCSSSRFRSLFITCSLLT